ncbi:fluoride efflux transporter FluC [Jeotgalibacillus soli]|uniref:Fluoride-specific ion channel FluC n=1 Tax=Jeotgalibacillus soli TaxID=889306 RepID=A0A0C2V8Z1_9BACL|nr:CrcB family protein [Jeotgalibacillus soli]KIL45442.1 hypothetical protein KP78_29860 [Jeotgalibacillus soli]
MNVFYVATGGAIGALLRWFITLLFPFTYPIPLNILLANLIGTFLLSFITFRFIEGKKGNERVGLFFGTGMLSSFTTVSAFSVESILVLKDNIVFGMVYIMVTLVGGTLLTVLGAFLASGLKKEKP